VGGYLPLAPGVSTDRYPIPQQTFKDVATVQSVTGETCNCGLMHCRYELSYSITSSRGFVPGAEIRALFRYL
jgi:hypothetical protein